MFLDREEAGEKLCFKLKKYTGSKKCVVIALARGGVILGKVIAGYFNFPLDALVVKKIGAPQDSELAIGAVGPKNTVYWNNDLCKALKIGKTEKNELKKAKEKARKEQEGFLSIRNMGLSGKSIILVDDGIATGATAIAASKFLKKEKTKEIILAVPVISADTLVNIRRYFDTVCFLKRVKLFYAVGQFYKSFPQIENEEVRKILETSH